MITSLEADWTMCDRRRTHVFLGAPPPPCELGGSAAGAPPTAGPSPTGWTHLELTWQEAHLRPAADEEADRSTKTQSSVQEYLDHCFPGREPGPGPEPEPGYGPPAEHLVQDPSVQTHFLSTWTLSQVLVLRGSPVPPQLPRPPLRVQEGGVVMETTTEGTPGSPAPTTGPLAQPTGPRAPPTGPRAPTNGPLAPTTRPQGAPTLLAHCEGGGRYSVLVAVVHPCYLKEVQVKAGSLVPLASIVVTDQSAADRKLLLWRRAAFWVLTVSPGDILLITELQVREDRWRAETVLQSTFRSKLLNLGPIAGSAPPAAPQQVDPCALSSLCGFLQEQRPLLVSLPRCPPQDLNRLPYATLRSLQVNTLVHALLRVTHTHTVWSGGAESGFQHQTVVTVEQPGGQQGALLLWGAAVDWLPKFNRDRAVVWDVRFLLVREGLTSDLPELHSTPWSSVRSLDPADPRAQDWTRTSRTRTSSSLELDLHTLLSQRYCGEVDLSVQVVSFQFQDSPPSQNAQRQVLDGCTPLADIVAALTDDITYTGCGRCGGELDTDANGIYCPCYPCLPHTAVRRYYRPAVLTVRGGGCSQVCVQVPPVPLQNILNVPPDQLHRSSAPGSQVKLLQVAAERIRILFLPTETVIITVRSHFLCDENSVPITQDFTLLDLQFPPDSL
ncbi:shieldin complex subunit 2%2C partial [Scomber scombrus]|uniref:Shieldin complex subunit 2, partial n=1 Tax=Scomber scombrus TaxID=13677 RepID=A0AAV1Q8C2_SCOSC